jgi:hypothetical protein
MTTQTYRTGYKRDVSARFPYAQRPLVTVRRAPKAILADAKHEGDTDTIFVFETATDFAAHAFGVAPEGKAEFGAIDHAADDWSDHQDLRSTCTKLVKGDNSRVRMSDELLTKMEAVHAPRAKYTQIYDVAGSRPDIGRFLAGDPINMRRRVKRPTDEAPLAIVADIMISAGISAEKQARRGAAVLALVRALGDIRPVTLYAMSGVDSSDGAIYNLIRMDTQPLDLSRASFLLQSAGVARCAAFAIANGYGFRGRWPYKRSVGAGAKKNSPLYRDHVREILAGMIPEEQFLYVASGYLHDEHAADLDTNPEKWLNAMIQQFGSAHDDSEAGHSLYAL